MIVQPLTQEEMDMNETEWRKTALKCVPQDAITAEREVCADMLNLTRSDAQLMAGEMTAQEWRTLSAVLVALQKRMRFNV